MGLLIYIILNLIDMSGMIKIKVDTKEKETIKFLQDPDDYFDNISCPNFLIQKNLDGLDMKRIQNIRDNFQIESLDVGDYQFYHTSQPDQPLVIIERKTLKDLNASIKDGRYKEQIIRLKSVKQHPIRVYFLIEGCMIGNVYFKRISNIIEVLDNKNFGITVKNTCKSYKFDYNATYSAFINILTRDDLHILETNDIWATLCLLNKLWIQIGKKYSEIIGDCKISPHLSNVEQHNFHYTKQIKSVKKENINPQVCFIDQLGRIPGVSPNFATFIAEKYNNMQSLILAYEEIDENIVYLGATKRSKPISGRKKRERLLENITVVSDNGNTRKVGPIVSTRIYHYLYGIVDPIVDPIVDSTIDSAVELESSMIEDIDNS